MENRMKELCSIQSHNYLLLFICNHAKAIIIQHIRKYAAVLITCIEKCMCTYLIYCPRILRGTTFCLHI